MHIIRKKYLYLLIFMVLKIPLSNADESLPFVGWWALGPVYMRYFSAQRYEYEDAFTFLIDDVPYVDSTSGYYGKVMGIIIPTETSIPLLLAHGIWFYPDEREYEYLLEYTIYRNELIKSHLPDKSRLNHRDPDTSQRFGGLPIITSYLHKMHQVNDTHFQHTLNSIFKKTHDHPPELIETEIYNMTRLQTSKIKLINNQINKWTAQLYTLEIKGKKIETITSSKEPNSYYNILPILKGISRKAYWLSFIVLAWYERAYIINHLRFIYYDLTKKDRNKETNKGGKKGGKKGGEKPIGTPPHRSHCHRDHQGCHQTINFYNIPTKNSALEKTENTNTNTEKTEPSTTNVNSDSTSKNLGADLPTNRETNSSAQEDTVFLREILTMLPPGSKKDKSKKTAVLNVIKNIVKSEKHSESFNNCLKNKQTAGILLRRIHNPGVRPNDLETIDNTELLKKKLEEYDNKKHH